MHGVILPDRVCTQVQKTVVYNRHLSEPKTGAENAEKIRAYAEKSLSKNTLIAYQSDLEHFYEWGGTVPCTPEVIASYLVEFAGQLAVSTLSRRVASINKAHEMQGEKSPTKSELVRMTLRGIKREHSTRQKQAAPLLRDDLIAILNTMGDDALGVRDSALLALGFACALRRSELVALNINDLEFVSRNPKRIRKGKAVRLQFRMAGRVIALSKFYKNGFLHLGAKKALCSDQSAKVTVSSLIVCRIARCHASLKSMLPRSG